MSGFRIAGGEVSLPNGIIKNETIASNAAISSSKMKHIFKAGTDFGFASTATPGVAYESERIVHVSSGTGRVISFNAMLLDTGTTTTMEFDVKINGVSILGSLLFINEVVGDGVPVTVNLGNTFTVDDVISVYITVQDSTGASGVYCWVDIEEDNAP